MNYEIYITRAAERDLNEAADYIEFILYNPKAADDLLIEAEKRIASLAFMPDKTALVEDPVLKAWGIRFITVNNYMAFYLIDEKNHKVIIVRFLYQRRDWNAILRKEIEPDYMSTEI